MGLKAESEVAVLIKNLAEAPLVSIVTPSFNSGQFLEQAIQSVISQDYPHLEHIIVDGGSTDSTLSILQRYATPVAWVSEPDAGQADAINKGFRRARGDIIGWLNADDTYQPGAIASAVTYLQAQPEVDLVYGSYNFIDADGRLLRHHPVPEFSLKRLLYGDTIIPQTSMFFRRRLIDAVGGVKPDLHYVMDWEFVFRLARQFTVKRAPETWANFRITSGTKSVQQPERFWPEIISVVQEVLRVEGGSQFKAWSGDALFMCHILAALEFARADQPEVARTYIERAFQINPRPDNHPAILASGLFKAAAYPWHSAFRWHTGAEKALDNLSQGLESAPEGKQVLGYLSLYRALRSIRQGRRSGIINYLSQARGCLGLRDWFNWYSTRLVVSALLKS